MAQKMKNQGSKFLLLLVSNYSGRLVYVCNCKMDRNDTFLIPLREVIQCYT